MSRHATNHCVLGIDPGLNVTGYGVVQLAGRRPQLVEAGIVRSTSGRSLDQRIKEIYDGVMEVLDAHTPAGVAIEQLYSHYQRPRTAILMGHARGVICLAAAQANVPVVHYAATQVKKILTGSGRAPKAQIQRAIQHELELGQPPEPPDVADALAIALCHVYLQQGKANLL